MSTSFSPCQGRSRVLAALLSVALVSLAGCKGSSGGAPVPPPPPPPLDPEDQRIVSFVVQPDGGIAGEPFGTTIEVRIVDGNGKPACDGHQTKLTLLDPAGAAKLVGTAEATCIDGKAEFPGLMVDRAGVDLVLSADIEGVGSGRSEFFSRNVSAARRHVILMVADGWGYVQIEAAIRYTNTVPVYGGFDLVGMTTGDTSTLAAHNGVTIYDPARFWGEFLYAILASPTDSASSASAMYTGVKTDTGRISVGPGAKAERLLVISELALANGLGSGAVSSVPISHATPAAWIAHNDSRGTYGPIMDEALFGDPGATSTGVGGHGPSPFLGHVLIGGGNPAVTPWFVSEDQLKKAIAETKNPDGWTVVQGDQKTNAGVVRLRAAAGDPKTERLLGLFGGPGGNIEFRLADGSGVDPRDATLAEMSEAALAVLERKPKGFYLMIEGGAVDWAGHGNSLDQNIGEMNGFNDAVAAVVKWIEDPTNSSDWSNTLLIVTGDHETGYLTAGPGVPANVPLGRVDRETLEKEKCVMNLLVKASWDDVNKNDEIDPGEEVYWAWNTGSHSNSLIPCFAKGIGSDRFKELATGTDPVRGKYIDNTDIHKVMLEVLKR